VEGMYKLSNSVLADLQFYKVPTASLVIIRDTRYTLVFSNIKVYPEDGSKMLVRSFDIVQTAQQHILEDGNIQCHPCNISNLVYPYSLFNTLLIYSMQPSPSSEGNPHFMEPESSLPQSRVPANCPYPEPARSSPYTPHPTSRRSILILIVVPPCILVSTNDFLQRMHCLLKHEILQFVFKCFTQPLHLPNCTVGQLKS
jgi:hypothetical protein